MKTVQRERLYTAAAIATAAITVILIIWLLRRNRRQAQQAAGGGSQGGAPSSTGLPEAQYPLRRADRGFSAEDGSLGWQVLLIQRALNDINSENLAEDGKLGPKTEAAIKNAFPDYISDGQISEQEFMSMCDKFREAYALNGTNYVSNSDLRLNIVG